MIPTRLLDLFCGAGGASEGYRQAGLEVAAVADNDEVALASHLENHPDAEHYEVDLADPTDFIGYWTPGEFDVVHGSPPCTQFSPANNNPDPEKGMELVRSFEQIVEELRPRYFVMENTPPILKHLDGFYPRKVKLNAANFGVPQTRVRAFCGLFPSPVPTHHRRGPRSRLDGVVLEKWVGAGTVLQFDGEIHTNRDQRPDGSRQVRPSPSPSLTAKSGMQWHLVSKQCVGGEKGTHATRELDEPSVTICTNDNGLKLCQKPSPTVTATEGKYVGGETDQRRAGRQAGRQLTPEECMLLQGFPADYLILGNKTQRYKQIGNAVPPPMARSIGLAIMELGG